MRETDDTSAKPVMPLATAVWLVDNTKLTFEQIARFVGVHILEIQAIADGEGETAGILGDNPLNRGQLTREELQRCENDPSTTLTLKAGARPEKKHKHAMRYTPIVQRHDKLDGIAWLLRNHGELNDSQICKLLRTTRPTIKAIREGAHWNMNAIEARDPVELDLCTRETLEKTVDAAKIAKARKENKEKKEKQGRKERKTKDATKAAAATSTPRPSG